MSRLNAHLVAGNGLVARFVAAVTSYPKHALLLVLLFTVGLGYCARNVRIDNNFAQLFSVDGAEAELRESYRKQFGADDGLLLVVLSPEHPEDPKFGKLLAEISEREGAKPEMRRVDSAAVTPVIWSDEYGSTFLAPAFGPKAPAKSFDERVKTLDSSLIGGGRLMSSDGKHFVIAAELRPEIDSYEKLVGPADQFREDVDAAVRASGVQVEHSYAGIPFTRLGAIASMQGDLLKLAPLTTAALALLLFGFFRRVLGVVVAQLTIGVAIVATAGVIGLCGDNLNQITIIYPVLLMVVTVASAVHLYHRFQHERALGLEQHDAARVASLHVTQAGLLTSVTTAIGFASLAIADVKVLHGFGLYLAAGVMISFLAVSTVVPACLSLFGDRMARPRLVREDKALTWLGRTTQWVSEPRRARILTITGVLAFVVLAGVSSRAVYDYRLSDNLNAQHPISRGNHILDEQMAGIVPVELSFRGAKGDFEKPENLARLAALGHDLEQKYGMPRAISLGAALEELNFRATGGREVPRSEAEVKQLFQYAGASDAGDLLRELGNKDYSHVRLRTNTHDGGARYVVQLQSEIEGLAAQRFAGTGIEVAMTGEAPVAYHGMNKLSRELMESILGALVAVVLVIGLVFRSARIALASILPNVIPTVCVLAAYSLSGAVIDPLPGVAFCIGLGMSVDDTVHVFARYREELSLGGSPREALVRAMNGLGGALVTSSVVLGVGFLALTLSSFDMNRMLGLLGASLIGLALVCDLVFTPALLSLFPLTKAKQAMALEAELPSTPAAAE
ncbi:MAG: RND family transporter [Polyangiaceae bacterium]